MGDAVARSVSDRAGADLARANVVVAIGTLLSRVTGFVRFALLAAVVDRALADAYNVANNVPNMLYELVLGGVLTATLIPMFTEQADAGDTESTSAVVSTALVVTTGLAIVATALSPLLVRLLTALSSGKDVDVAQLRGVALFFAFWFVPQIAFYGVTFLASALLNARRRFFAAAWAPVVNNLVVIVALAVMTTRVPKPRSLAVAHGAGSLRLWLAVPTTAGVVAMAISLLPALHRAGVRIRFRPDRRHPAVRRVLGLSRWTAGYVVANQVALFFVTALTKPGSGGATAYMLAFLIMQLPIGLLAMSVATTFAPELARARLAKDRARFARTFDTGLGALAVLLLPTSAGLVALARPLVTAVLERGYYSAASASDTAHALAAFGVGLFFLAGYLFTLRGFYAHDDTRSAFVINVVENVVNMLLGVALVGRFGVPGLAWSFTVAYIVAFVLALRALLWKIRATSGRTIVGSLTRLGLAAAACGEVAWLASRAVGSDTFAGSLARLVAGTVVGGGVYVASLWWLRAPELGQINRLVRRLA